MSYNIALSFEDGVTRFITCKENETVLDAAYRSQINLPMDCSDGVCGTCKGSCHQGEYDLGDEYLEDALSDDEVSQGLVLTCQMKPSSDCVVEVPVASSMCKTGSVDFQAEIDEVNLISSTAIELKVTAKEDVPFLAGQYINIHVPGTTEVRSYSFSSVPGSRELRFLIRNIPGGLMSTWLTGQARSGDELTLSGPLGVFYLRPIARPILMLAAGTGLAPFLSMLAQLKQSNPDHPVHMIYGARNDEDMVYVAELEQLAREMSQFTFVTVLSGPDNEHPRKGYITDHLDTCPILGNDVDVYLCGPPRSVDSTLSAFRTQGIEPISFHYEKFTHSGPEGEEEVA